MPGERRRGMMMEGLIMPTKIRKRGCSSSSSASSRIHSYRLNKRAILVGKSRAGLGGSRSSTPVPTTPLRSAINDSQSGKSTQPVSARRLAATLWEMNESNVKQHLKKNGSKMVFKMEKMQSAWGLHLSDPLHSSTLSEKIERCGTGTRQRSPPILQGLRSAEEHAADFDSISNASFMETETRSRPPTSSGSRSGDKNRLKDISNALTTSKELLKIINRIWAHADRPSSSMSVISALHAELERARMQVNHLIEEQCLDKKKNEINHLMRCFVEEKASWKNKEHRAIEAVVGSIAGELEVERKLRRRLESLNKKLGKELAETKSSFIKAVKELESEKRAREITEQVCDELARNVDDDRVEVENQISHESIDVHEEAEADKLRQERVQMKLSESRHQFEEKNSAISKLRKHLEVFLGTKRDKDEEKGTWLRKSNISFHQNEQKDENAIDSKEESADSYPHLIELNMNNDKKCHKWAYTSASSVVHDSRRLAVDEIKARNSISGQVSRRSHEVEKEVHRRSYYEETQRYKGVKGLHDRILSSSWLSSSRDRHSPSQQSCASRDTCVTVDERQRVIRMGDVRGEGQSSRRSKW